MTMAFDQSSLGSNTTRMVAGYYKFSLIAKKEAAIGPDNA
jgi:hypothetical protein